MVPPGGTQATRVTLDGTRYAGLITQPAVLATGGWPTRPEPSRRGRDLRARYFCLPIPVEPPVTPPVNISAGTSIRQAVEADTAPQPCAACHLWIDGPGFAFGHFDAVGAYQDTDGGLPIDTTGVLASAGGAMTEFAGPRDLANLTAAAPEVAACFATKWLAFVAGTPADPDEVPPPDDGSIGILSGDAAYIVKRATIQGRLSLRGTIRAVTETHTFLDP